MLDQFAVTLPLKRVIRGDHIVALVLGNVVDETLDRRVQELQLGCDRGDVGLLAGGVSRSCCCLDVGGELLLPMCGVALVSGAGGGVQSQTLYLPASYALIFE